MFFPLISCCAPSNCPLCTLFILDHRTFKIQIYGQTWSDRVFQVLEPDALGTKSRETVGERQCRPCSFETKAQPSGYSQSLSCTAGAFAEPLGFPGLQRFRRTIKETVTENEEPTYPSSNCFTFSGAPQESAYMFGKRFKVFSHCTHFLVCASH